MFSSWLHCLFLHTPTYNTGQHESNYNFRYSMQWLILNLEKIQSETVYHHSVHNITKPWLKTVGLMIQKTFILFDLSVWLKNSRYLNSFNFCGMFWPIAPTAACGTCCQRVNCVGSLNVHHHVAFIAWSFLLGFLYGCSQIPYFCALGWPGLLSVWLGLSMLLWSCDTDGQHFHPLCVIVHIIGVSVSCGVNGMLLVNIPLFT